MDINLLQLQIDLFNPNFHPLEVRKAQAHQAFMAEIGSIHLLNNSSIFLHQTSSLNLNINLPKERKSNWTLNSS